MTNHALALYHGVLAEFADATTGDFQDGSRESGPASIGGVVTNLRERPARGGDGTVAFFVIEDDTGTLEVMVFSTTFKRLRSVLVLDEPLLLSGTVGDEATGAPPEYRMLLEDAVPLSELELPLSEGT